MMRAARAVVAATAFAVALTACGAGAGGESAGTTPGGFEVVTGEFAFAKEQRCEQGEIGGVEDLIVGPGCYENYPWRSNGSIEAVVEDAQPVLGAGTTLGGDDGRFTLTYRGGMWRLVDVEGWTYDPTILYSGPEASLASVFVDLEIAPGETLVVDAEGIQDLHATVFHEGAHYLGPDRSVLDTGMQGRGPCGDMFEGLEEAVEITRDDVPDGVLTLAMCFGEDHPPLETYPEPLLWLLNSGTPDGTLRSAYLAINEQDPDADVLTDARASLEAIAAAAGVAPQQAGLERFDTVWAEFMDGTSALASGDWRTDAAKDPYWALADGGAAVEGEGDVLEAPEPAEPEYEAEGEGPFASDEEYEDLAPEGDYARGYDAGYELGDEDWLNGEIFYMDPTYMYDGESDEFMAGYADGYLDGNPDAEMYAEDEGSALGGGGDVFVDKDD